GVSQVVRIELSIQTDAVGQLGRGLAAVIGRTNAVIRRDTRTSIGLWPGYAAGHLLPGGGEGTETLHFVMRFAQTEDHSPDIGDMPGSLAEHTVGGVRGGVHRVDGIDAGGQRRV